MEHELKRRWEKRTEVIASANETWYHFETEMDHIREGARDVIEWCFQNWKGEEGEDWHYFLLANETAEYRLTEDGGYERGEPEHGYFTFILSTQSADDAVMFTLVWQDGK